VISVVLAARNAAGTLAQQLDALSRQDYAGEWELLVADNGSTDHTAQVASDWQDRLPMMRVVPCHERPGKALACNVGTREARGEFIAYCDADDVVSPRWLGALESALETDGLATGPIEMASLNTEKMYWWRGTSRWDSLPAWHGFLPAALGCNLAVRREVFNEIAGFSESNRHGEDFDFVWRAQLAGASLGFAPEALVHWRLRASSGAWFRRHVEYGMSDVGHFVRFSQYGMPRWSGQLRRWIVVAALPMILFDSYRYLWLTEAGITLGRLIGSLRHHVLYL
jgi:glycosyltransferase involved in cell wall biosynthesis